MIYTRKDRKRILSLFKSITFCFMLMLLSTAVSAEESYHITITSPSEANGAISPGHSFFITGTIAGTFPLPDGVSLRVSVLNELGEEIRFAESSRKKWNVIDRFCKAFFYYADDVDPERLSITAKEFPCLIVEDSNAPEKSIRNANIKCWFSDKDFNAFIPYATDVEHGLLFNDGIAYTDAQGSAYDALPDGYYTAMALLQDKNGQMLACTRKTFSISPAQNTILCRFHPDEQYQRMMRFAAENHLSMNIDYLPGYYKDPNGNDKGGLRAMFIGGDVACYNNSHVHMVEYLSSKNSSSLTIELPYIEKYFNVDDPERFTVYYYDIGEPVIQVCGQTLEGTIIPVENGDKLRLCRADLIMNGSEGYLDFNTAEIQATDTDFSDGVTLYTSYDCQLAISGLVFPYQLKDEEIIFDPENNNTELLNRIENIVYIVWDGSETNRYKKPVTLTRKFKDASIYDSMLEFYHVFSRDEINPSGDYFVALYGIDKNGERVDGTADTFVINRTPAKSIDGLISIEGINNFGNISLNISEDRFRAGGFDEGDIVTVQIGEKIINMPFVKDYTDVKRGEPLLVPTDGKIAMWISMGSFAEIYEIAQRGQNTWFFPDSNKSKPVILSMKQKAGYLENYELRHKLAGMKPINVQMPGQTEEEFANFREVATTGMKRDTLFRSSSPINNRAGRCRAADNCIKAHGINHIINMYDTKEQAESMDGYWNTYASKVDTAYIHMGLDYTSERFGNSMARVMEYIAQNDGKYVVHCILGEHRTGAVCMILSALMGASYDELVEDYMQTCCNLYGVETGTKQYALLVDDNVNSILRHVFKIEDPKHANLKELAHNFVLSTGISEETLALVKKHLSK